MNRTQSNLTYKVIATIVILVVAAFLAANVHYLLALTAILALLLWL